VRTSAIIVCKRGAQGCVAFPGPVPDDIEDGIVAAGFHVEVYNVLGAGDAFLGGYLRGWLRDEPIVQCCRLGNACGAIVVSRHGCAPAMPTWAELELFFAARNRKFRLREDAQLEHAHWATTRARSHEELNILAIDHRSQFEDLAAAAGASAKRISRFKMLGLLALDSVARGEPGFGVLLDGRYGSRRWPAPPIIRIGWAVPLSSPSRVRWNSAPPMSLPNSRQTLDV
jgi:5-dehydro-2-deoxygluconokinase